MGQASTLLPRSPPLSLEDAEPSPICMMHPPASIGAT